MARPDWTFGKVLAYAALLAVIIPTAMALGRDYVKLLGYPNVPAKERKDERPPAKQAVVNTIQLARVQDTVNVDRSDWRTGDLSRKYTKDGSTYYEASVSNASGREVFKLKIDGAGVPFSGGNPPPRRLVVTEEEMRELLPGVVSSLTIGGVRTAGKGGNDREVSLTLGGVEVARLKIDGAKQTVDTKKTKRQGWLFDEKQMRWTGWATVAALVLSFIYTPLKRLLPLLRRK
ncbi:MAG: hypothetical protein HY675_04525 [Chloroflexi bacterium]|nr:hypothetical protein [Chloroflexota bacterium]